MKKLATILFALLTMSLQANIHSTIKKVNSVVTKADSTVKELTSIPDSSKATFNAIYNDVKEGVVGLASALKVGAEHVYAVLVKQQIVYAIVYLLVLVFSIALLKFAYSQYNVYDVKEIAWAKETQRRSTEIYFHISFVYFLASLITGAIMLLVGICNIDNIIMGFVNPEYGAIKDIMDFVKK